jgi:ribosome-binding ATPase
MKLGIIGLSGSGKSTIFDALTQSDADSGSKTETRMGTIPVPDERVTILSDMYNPRKTIFAQVEYLLPATQGQAQDKEQSIWTKIRDCDALIQVIRNFTVYGSEAPDPYADFLALDQELMLADQVVVEKRIERVELDVKRNRKIDEEEYALLKTCLSNLEAEIPLRKSPEIAAAPQLKGFAFLSAKPKLVLFNNEDENMDPPDAAGRIPEEECMVVRGKLEQELTQMSPEEAQEFLTEFDITSSAMDRVIKGSYGLLGLISFFTVGEDEVRAWTIRRDTMALDAADVIHSDIKKGFIRAELVAYDDLISAGTYAEARKKGTVRLEGKTYPVKDGDIINFRFNV